jgi:plasmid stabilization system protein ParE
MNLARDPGIGAPTLGDKTLTKRVSWFPDQGRDSTTLHFNNRTVRESRLATLQTVFRSMGIAPREMGRQAAGGPSLNRAGTQPPLRLVFQRLGRTDELVVAPHHNARISERVETQGHELKRRIRRIEPGPGSSPDFVDTVVPQTAIVSYWTGDRYPKDE